MEVIKMKRIVSAALGFAVLLALASCANATKLSIGGKKVVSVQSAYQMTMGGARSECSTNACIKEMYQCMVDNCGDETGAPEHFGEMINLDIGNYYREVLEISFMETKGLEGAVIQQFKIYGNLTENPTNDPPWNSGAGAYLGELLIRDVTQGKWYKVAAGDSIFDQIDEIRSAGVWVEIFNNIA